MLRITPRENQLTKTTWTRTIQGKKFGFIASETPNRIKVRVYRIHQYRDELIHTFEWSN